MNVFRTPRLHLLGMTPKQIARSELANAPKGVPDIPLRSPLEDWHQGFSRKASVDHFHDVGAALPVRPQVDPDLPSNVTTLTSEELGTLHAQFVAFTQWLEVELALLEIGAEEEKAYVDHVEAEIRLQKSGTNPDKAAKTLMDPKYIDSEKTALIAKAKAKLMRARVSGYERCCSALSREMTRRGIELERRV